MVYLLLWNNLSFHLSDALMHFFFRGYCNLQLKYILPSTLFPKDEPALSLPPPPSLHHFPAITPFLLHQLSCLFGLHTPMLSKGIHKFVQGKGRWTLIQLTAWGKKGEGQNGLSVFKWEWAATSAPTQKSNFSFGYLISQCTLALHLTSVKYILFNLANPQQPL